MSHNINTEKIKKQRGLIKYIIWLFIIILILSYLGFDLKSFMESDSTQGNLGYVWEGILSIWDEYLKPVYDFLSDFLGPYIHDTLNNLRNHENILYGNIPDNLVPTIK